MKELMFVPVHSVADVITNSSSELFICNTEKTVEQVGEFLTGLAELVGETGHGVGSIKMFEGPTGLMQSIFDLGLEWLSGGHQVKTIVMRFVPWSEWESMRDTPQFQDFYDSPYHPKAKKDWDDYDARHKQWLNEAEGQIKHYFDINADILNKYVKNVIVMESESDNTIPHDFFDIIERRLNGVRFHLG